MPVKRFVTCQPRFKLLDSWLWQLSNTMLFHDDDWICAYTQQACRVVAAVAASHLSRLLAMTSYPETPRTQSKDITSGQPRVAHSMDAHHLHVHESAMVFAFSPYRVFMQNICLITYSDVKSKANDFRCDWLETYVVSYCLSSCL